MVLSLRGRTKRIKVINSPSTNSRSPFTAATMSDFKAPVRAKSGPSSRMRRISEESELVNLGIEEVGRMYKVRMSAVAIIKPNKGGAWVALCNIMHVQIEIIY